MINLAKDNLGPTAGDMSFLRKGGWFGTKTFLL